MNTYEIDLTKKNWKVNANALRRIATVTIGDKVTAIVGALKISPTEVLLWDCDGVNYIVNISNTSVSDLIELENGLGKRIFY